MEMTLNNKFCELSFEETLCVDGGEFNLSDFSKEALVGGISGAAGGAVGGAIAGGPAGALIGGVTGGVAGTVAGATTYICTEFIGR